MFPPSAFSPRLVTSWFIHSFLLFSLCSCKFPQLHRQTEQPPPRASNHNKVKCRRTRKTDLVEQSSNKDDSPMSNILNSGWFNTYVIIEDSTDFMLPYSWINLLFSWTDFWSIYWTCVDFNASKSQQVHQHFWDRFTDWCSSSLDLFLTDLPAHSWMIP